MSELLVLGATGAIGRFLLPRLRQAGLSLRALSRQARADLPNLQWIRGGLETTTFNADSVQRIISVGPLDHFVTWLERQPLSQLRRVVAVSSMSAASKRESQDPHERALAQHLLACEQRLQRYCEAHAAAWVVLRPTLIYGAGVDHSLSPIVRLARRTRLFPWIPAAHGLRQPVHADDVAAACASSLTAIAAPGHCFELGGAEPLSYARMLERVRQGLQFHTVPLPLPISALRVASRLSGRGRGMVQRLTQDLSADIGPAVAALSYRPRAFQPGPECWSENPRILVDN